MDDILGLSSDRTHGSRGPEWRQVVVPIPVLYLGTEDPQVS